MELNLKILALLLQCTSIFRCILFMKAKKKKKFILFIPPIKKLFLSLSHSVPLSLSQITQLSFTLQIHSQSVPLFLSQITPLPNHPSSSSHPLDPAVPRPQITHRRSSLTVTLSLSLDSHSFVDWVWLWDWIDRVWLFRVYAPMSFCGCEIRFVGWWGDGVVVCGGVTTVVDSWWS